MPDVIVKDVTPDHEFIVLACDGEYCTFNFCYGLSFFLSFYCMGCWCCCCCHCCCFVVAWVTVVVVVVVVVVGGQAQGTLFHPLFHSICLFFLLLRIKRCK